MKTFVVRCAIAAVVLVSSSPGWSQAMLPELKKQPNAQAVLDELAVTQPRASADTEVQPGLYVQAASFSRAR